MGRKDDLEALQAENDALRARVDELERLHEGEAVAFLHSILAAVPEEWLEGADAGLSAADERESYRSYLLERLEAPRGFVEEAARVR